ncbi:MAG: acetolactate synthase large subunit [Gammaproteobacteria bacterium]|nr:acetolactate synthase large subunit [Gammaproteobacteria bacterium]
MNASDLFLKCLEAQGVTAIFGVPGEENADLMMALLNSPIQFVTCRHEQTASFMADMFGRITGKPGVCLSTLGPGATNLITGVANANMDNIPLIAIVGQATTNRLHKESHQNMDAVSMYKPVTKWSTSIREAEVIPEVIYKAFALATQAKPGAVMIEFPEDIAKMEVSSSTVLFSDQVNMKFGHSIESIDQTLQLIEAAQKPIILIGPGCTQEGCDEELAEFIERTRIYAATTFMGKGSFTTEHPQSLFCVGLGVRDIALEAFHQADLVICIGYRLVEWLPEYWNTGESKKIVHIDVGPAEIDQRYLPTLQLLGSIKYILEELNMRLTPSQMKQENLFASVREKITQDLALESTSDCFPLKPQRILHDLRAVLKVDDILISDVGAHKMWVARQFPAYKSKTCFIYNGFCAMGGAIPGAIIAKWLNPEQTVVAVCGDGGFMMSIQALVTAVQYQTPIIIIIWEDDYYGLVKWKQEVLYQQVSHVELVNPDLASVAKSFGCNARRILQPQDFIPTLELVKKDNTGPSVIVLPVDYSENMKLTKRLGEIVAH